MPLTQPSVQQGEGLFAAALKRMSVAFRSVRMRFALFVALAKRSHGTRLRLRGWDADGMRMGCGWDADGILLQRGGDGESAQD
jgi:hypothetical protein